MKFSKILIAVVVLIIAYFAYSKFVQKTAVVADKKAAWYVKLDQNGDGSLSLEELKVMDANGDGKISVEEATAYGVPPEELARWDKDGDGSISEKELNACGC